MFVSSLEMFWIAIGYGVAAGIVAMILPYGDAAVFAASLSICR